jgi:quercetin dioxygenase-like cupin family protein
MFEQQPSYPDRVRLPLCFDPAGLREDLAAVMAEHWQEHFVRQNYDGEWSAMPLRAAEGETHPIRKIYSDPGATRFVDEPLLARTPHFRALLDSLECPLRSVRLMRLAPGSEIKTHEDHDLAAEQGKARLHVPVTTGPGVEFRLNGRPVEMAPGELWYLRLSDPHGVTNRGETDRVHLVIDTQMNDWLRAQLDGGASA